MSAWVWIIIVVAVLLIVLSALGSAGRRAAVGGDPTQFTFSPDLMTEVNALVQQDQRIAAIKLLRTQTPGLSLLAAKNIVDRMAQRQPGTGRPTGPSLTKPPLDADLRPSSAAVPLDVELQVRSMVTDGQKIAAIKLVREVTGWGLAQAKAYTDTL